MKKIKLIDFKVQSFVTSVDAEASMALKGGFSAGPTGCQQTPPQQALTHDDICRTVLQTVQSCISGCVSCPECAPQ